MRVLILEDDKGISEMLKILIQSYGDYEVTQCYSVADAFNAVKTTDFDFIFSDYRVEHDLGVNFTSRIALDGFKGFICLMTADKDITIENTRDFGVHAVLIKPFEIEDVEIILDSNSNKPFNETNAA